MALHLMCGLLFLILIYQVGAVSESIIGSTEDSGIKEVKVQARSRTFSNPSSSQLVCSQCAEDDYLVNCLLECYLLDMKK